MKRNSLSWMQKKASYIFNKAIRERDQNSGCISCGRPFTDAGHYFSGGSYPVLKYNPNNVHGQCRECNTFMEVKPEIKQSYTENLIKKIGIEEFDKLVGIAEMYKKNADFKWSKSELLNIINKYK